MHFAPRSLPLQKHPAVKVASLFLLLAVAEVGQADTMTLNFKGLADGSKNAAVQTYLNGKMPIGTGVTVTGAVASTSYTGDGHVVGPVDPITHHVTSFTLFNKNNAPFIMNSATTGADDRITMIFSGMKVNQISFDYEILPDGTGVLPDFTFNAGTPGHTTTYISKVGITPPSPGYTYTHSPVSGPNNTEASKQLLASSGVINFGSTVVTELDFIDWPVHIGVNNLVITFTPTTAPEPASLVLVACGVGAFPAFRRYVRRR